MRISPYCVVGDVIQLSVWCHSPLPRHAIWIHKGRCAGPSASGLQLSAGMQPVGSFKSLSSSPWIIFIVSIELKRRGSACCCCCLVAFAYFVLNNKKWTHKETRSMALFNWRVNVRLSAMEPPVSAFQRGCPSIRFHFQGSHLPLLMIRWPEMSGQGGLCVQEHRDYHHRRRLCPMASLFFNGRLCKAGPTIMMMIASIIDIGAILKQQPTATVSIKTMDRLVPSSW